MAFDLGKFLSAHRFRIETDRLGTLLVHGLTVSALSSLRKEYVSFADADAMGFVRRLTTLVCQQDVNDSGDYTNDRITPEQAELLSEDELEQFSERFIEKNRYLKEKSDSEKRKNENDEQVTHEPHSDLVKNPEESWRVYLKRVMHQYRADQEQRTKQLFESFRPKNLFSDSIINLIDQNREISGRLGGAISHYDSIKIPELPENPAYETNRHLKAIGSEFSETSRLIKNMNDLGLQMAIEMANGAKTSKRDNQIMIALGLVTLIFSAIMSYLSYVSSNESTRDIQKLLSNSVEIQESAIKSNQTNRQLAHDDMDNAERRLEAIESAQNKTAARLQQLDVKMTGLSKTDNKQRDKAQSVGRQ